MINKVTEMQESCQDCLHCSSLLGTGWRLSADARYTEKSGLWRQSVTQREQRMRVSSLMKVGHFPKLNMVLQVAQRCTSYCLGVLTASEIKFLLSICFSVCLGVLSSLQAVPVQ